MDLSWFHKSEDHRHYRLQAHVQPKQNASAWEKLINWMSGKSIRIAGTTAELLL